MTNKTIQRWDIDCEDIDASMFTNKTGDYVLYDDHVAAMEAIAQPVQPAMGEIKPCPMCLGKGWYHTAYAYPPGVAVPKVTKHTCMQCLVNKG